MTRHQFMQIVIGIGIVILVGFLLTACAEVQKQTTFLAVCAYQPLGNSDAGIPYMALSCDTQEAKK